MKLLYKGKTKDVYELPDGNYLLRMKDDATGKDGVFDPGENSVGLTIQGLGKQSLSISKYFFDILTQHGIPHHMVSCDLQDVCMTVKPATVLGKGVEVICRYRAVGGFLRRYGDYVEEGAKLPAYVEFTLKNDDRGDPPITQDGLVLLDIMTAEECENLKRLTVKICGIIKDALAQKGLELYDIKLEFGRSGGEIILIDEISAGSMRVYKGDAWLQPEELYRALDI